MEVGRHGAEGFRRAGDRAACEHCEAAPLCTHLGTHTIEDAFPPCGAFSLPLSAPGAGLEANSHRMLRTWTVVGSGAPADDRPSLLFSSDAPSERAALTTDVSVVSVLSEGWELSAPAPPAGVPPRIAAQRQAAIGGRGGGDYMSHALR